MQRKDNERTMLWSWWEAPRHAGNPENRSESSRGSRPTAGTQRVLTESEGAKRNTRKSRGPAHPPPRLPASPAGLPRTPALGFLGDVQARSPSGVLTPPLFASSVGSALLQREMQ